MQKETQPLKFSSIYTVFDSGANSDDSDSLAIEESKQLMDVKHPRQIKIRELRKHKQLLLQSTNCKQLNTLSNSFLSPYITIYTIQYLIENLIAHSKHFF